MKIRNSFVLLSAIALFAITGLSSCKQCQTCTSLDGTIVEENCRRGPLKSSKLTMDKFNLEAEHGQTFNCVDI